MNKAWLVSLAVLLLSASGNADTVHFRVGNALKGQLEWQPERLRIDLLTGGSIVLDPAGIVRVEYEFDLLDGDAFPVYQILVRRLEGDAEFQAIAPQLESWREQALEAWQKPGEEFQEEIERFAMNRLEVLRELLRASRMTRCDRARYLTEKMSPEDFLRGADDLLSSLRDLYAIYLLADSTQPMLSNRDDRLAVGLRLANHWNGSIPEEVIKAQREIAALALAYQESVEVASVEEAWHQVQTLLRFNQFLQRVNPEESLHLFFRLYRRALPGETGTSAAMADPAQAEAWIALLAGESAYSWRKARESGRSIESERKQMYAERLIALLKPGWTLDQHPDWIALENVAGRNALRQDALLLNAGEILRREGFLPEAVSFNPLKEIPGFTEGQGLFSGQTLPKDAQTGYFILPE